MMVLANLFNIALEAFLMCGAGLSIIGIRLKIKTIFLIGIIYAILVYSVRQFYIVNNIPFGSHTIILFTSFALLLIFLAKQKILDSIVATLINVLLVFIGEGMLLFPILNLLNLDPINLSGKPVFMMIAGGLSAIPLIITFFMGYVFKITLIDFDKFKESKKV